MKYIEKTRKEADYDLIGGGAIRIVVFNEKNEIVFVKDIEAKEVGSIGIDNIDTDIIWNELPNDGYFTLKYYEIWHNN